MTPEDFLGKDEVINEDGVPVTKGVMGEFLKRVQEPGIVLIDEVMRFPRETLVALIPLFERAGEMTVQHMEGCPVIKKHPKCVILLADNTHGTGDGIDMFDSSSQDQAFLNRIEATIKFDYPEKDVEVQMCQDWCPGVTSGIAEEMVTLGRSVRESWRSGELSIPFSPRTLQTYAEITNFLKDPVVGFRMAYTDSLPTEDEQAHAEQVVFSIFGSK